MEDSLEFQASKGRVERVTSGIHGLDELIQGGFPKGSIIVVSGSPGSGKTICCLQWLWDGLQKGEKCLYIGVESPRLDIIDQAFQFGWNLEPFESSGLLRFHGLDSSELYDTQRLNEIMHLVQEEHYERVVLDSITSFAKAIANSSILADTAGRGMTPALFSEMARSNVFKLMDTFKKTGSTVCSISQDDENNSGDRLDRVSSYKGDGLIYLDIAEIGNEENRTLRVKKLRKTKINSITQDFEFTEKGITIRSKDV